MRGSLQEIFERIFQRFLPAANGYLVLCVLTRRREEVDRVTATKALCAKSDRTDDAKCTVTLVRNDQLIQNETVRC